jgi:hypothetical protein
MAYVNDTGLPSVTDIIGRYISTQWMTEESRERGTAVHEACFAHIMGRYVIPLKADWQGYFDSFKRWCDIAEPEVELAEERLTYDRLGYCGQPDFVGRVKIMRPGRGLIDWKTSIACEKWFRLQGVGYMQLAGMNGLPCDWGGNLRLKRDGGVPLFDYWPPMANDFGVFMAAIQLYKYFS